VSAVAFELGVSERHLRGSEAIVSFDRFFGALMAGPTTVGVVHGVGQGQKQGQGLG
jgi:hypothetical protein